MQLWYVTDKSTKLGSIECYGLCDIEEDKEYIQVVKLRDINPDHEFLQVFAGTFKLQCSERGKNSMWWQG